MGCVNRSSKEFKNLATRNNVDSNTLELITHKYWLEAGNETLFPTDVYIQAQLGNTHYQESGKSVRKLWEMRYNAPQEFKSLRELQVARKEASNFFPQSAIVHYKNAKGNYVLSVKRPVETVNYDKDNFFEELDNMSSVRDVKKLNLGIKENQTYTLDKVQQLYHRFNEDRISKVLADKVFSIAKDLGLEVTFGETLPFGTIGKYTNNNTIIYKKSFLERDMMNSMKAPIILHEVLHALSMYALSNQTKNWKRSEDLEKFRTEMNSLYQDLKTNPILKGERGIVDVFEFVAELGNPVFRSKIQEIDKQNKDKKSFWSRVLDAFKTLLGLHTSNTYYQRSMNALEKALDAFDIDTYMRYNGIKNPLRKGYNEKEWDFRTLSDDKLKDKVTKEVADNTINKDNQRLENKNNTQYEQSIKSAGQLFKDAYSIVKGGSSKDNEGFQGNTDAGKSIRERVHEESSKQQKELISWARKTDNIIVEPNDYFEEEYGESQSGSETTVWIANDNGRNVAIKSISLNHYATPEKLLDRILIHNTAFPSTAMEILKVGVSDNGMSIIVKQPWIESGETIANPKEIENYMLSQGFVHTKGQGVNAEYSKDNYVVTDIRPENVIKQPDGTLAVIDCFAMFKSEEAQRTSQSTLKDFISSLSGKELKDELALIEQENADYDLVNNIPEDNKHSGKAVPQDFTFADDTTVKAPFKPNAQQIDALNEMDRFMKSNETSMTLSGYAGTGKTSLMEMIAKKGQKQNRPVMFCATTNKAAAVLNDRVSKAGFKASTLNKVFGINVEVDSSKTYNARNLVNVLKDVDIMPGTTIIIDEASMINEENYKILNDIAKEHRLKIIYVGDEAQLAPVNEDKISKVFRNGEGKVIRLTQVERTDDNAILKEATAIRNGEPLSKVSSFNSKGEGVAYISPQHQDAINEVIDKYVKGLKQNPNYFRILAYTNKAVTAYNNQVRELLGYDSPIPHVGEPMTGYANWGYEWRTKSYRFINSESYKVTQVGRPATVQTRLDNGTPVVMQAVPITLEDSLGNIDTFNFMDIKNNAQNRQSAMILANEKKRLWNEARRAYGREAKATVYAKINAIDSFLFVNDNIEDNSHNLLQAKTIDFGYALTIHKSQGSTFTHVLMDDVDVSRTSMSGNNAANAMEMIDLGEEFRNDAANAELKSSEEVDLGDLSDVEVENAQPDQAANIKQQLEYVGVSRATDTVTIISNNVKKEGSPLHPTKEVKGDKVNSNTTHLNITPANSVDKKAAIKGAMANKFIGFAEGIFNSSTGKYAQQAGDKANTGNYTSDDVVFVSIPGKRGNEDVRHQQQDRTIAEALKALKAGATLLTDNKAYTENSTYNEGEKRLAKALNNAGAVYSEIQKDNQIIGVWTINTNNFRSKNKNSKENGTEEYKTTDEFRRVQEGSRKFSEKGISDFNEGRRSLNDQDRERIGGILGRLLESNSNGSWHGVQSNLTHTNKDGSIGSFNIGKVDGNLFHDIFEVTKTYLYNGELIDLHDDYSDCNCYITSDGLCGFAIEPNGNLVSVFSLSPRTNKGFLYAIRNFIKQEGATHLDAYESKKQPLQEMYSKTLGFYTAATMDYNMEYDHDDIAKNHGNPQVVFMVDHEVAEPKHFDKDSYDAAQQYQLSQLSKEVDGLYSEDGKSPLTIYRGYALMEDREAKSLNETVGKTAVDYDETLKGALYFTSSEEEATDYAKSRTDKSPEPPTAEHPEGNRINRHYTGDYAKVSKFHILSTAKVEHYKDIRDYIKNGRNTTADVIVLDRGTLWADNTEYIVKNPDVIVFDNNKGTETEVTNPSFPEGQTQKVSLPGYEYFNELYDETPVDAAWKIPYLKELDAQLSMENSFEENQNIINQMDTVLQATSEKEYLQESKDSQKKEVETNLSEYDKLNKQIDNLLNGDKDLEELGASLSATEVRHTAELIVNSISDEITNLQKEEGLARTLFPSLNTDLDFQSASRKQIVETVGLDRLIERTKTLFSPQVMDYEDTDTMMQAQLITDNWDAIMYLAADIFAMNEGFGITKDYSRGNFTTTEDSKVDFDNFNDYSNDQDIAAEEGEKDEQEHWQVESRTIDVLNSMSALVRLGLHECYLLDAEGNKVYSKWGIAERVNPRESVNSILRWTQGALSLDDMIKRLSNKQKQNPWLFQLIERLSDKSGKETDFQSQFYGVFSKHFQLYSIVLLENGKYYSMTVNSHPALSEAMKSISALFKIGEHPLFGNNGKINSKLLGTDQTTGKNSEFNLHKALTELREIDKAIKEGKTLNDTMSKTATDNILGISKSFGYNITEEMLTDVVNAENIKKITESLGYIVKDLDKALQAQNKGTLKEYDPFKFGGESSIGGSLRNLLTPITDKLEDTAVNAFYDSGKMYQSYITPSFMTKLMNKFRQEDQAFEDFIMDEYGSSEWFKFPNGDVDKGWRNEWLRILAKDENARKVFDHKVELNFNKHNYMRNMSDAEYTLSLITEYFAESTDNNTNMVPAWFRVPMQSNKPSSEFIKFYSYRGASYKDSIVYGLHNMFLQELSRIQTVRMRNMDKKDAGFIKNFDTNGRRFNFLPVLNNYLENTADRIAKRDILRNEDDTISSDNSRLASLLQKKVDGEVALTAEEEAELGKLADRVIRQHMEDRVQSILNNWENNGILEAAKSIKGIYPSELKDEEAADWVRKQVENYLWNDAFASKNILQLTLTDIAFYKDTEDLQKRLAQLHAPGVRGNIYATDYNGNRVSDGKYRTFILQDFDSFKSNIIANIAEVFDRRIAAAPENQKAQMMALKESLVGKDGKYTKINVTDAQGYSSPSSYRKKAFIFGRWSKQAEDIYQKLQKGEYNYTDLETAFQPLKPFVYSKLTKDMGVANAPIHSMEVPFQAKNAEYLLIMADAILKGEKLSRPNLLRAVYRVMEDSEKLNPTKGIDTVQFESAIKSGLQGKMNIFQFRDMEGGEEAAYTYMMNQIFKEETDATGERVYRNYNTDTFVHEASYEDYCLQQEVPEHFKEHSQAHGSQIRMITPSDLDLYTTDENGNQVDNYYEWTEPDGTHRRVKADEFRKEYEKTIADNIEESINNLAAELHFNSNDKKEQNIALSKILQREIMSSPRYGIDLLQACSIDKETGEFRIPKGDPIQAKRIEQLINSIIKNRVNKQKIAGGPIVQVSNFGTSTQLHIRFNDKQGNLMPLEEEYDASEHDNLYYKEYLKRNQGGIAYFEVFAPIWSNELFDKFSNADGTINVDAINAVDPELLKMVSYRIPTEDKYSCAPMKVVGFMPREAGDAIMLPYELTEIDDSDFDVDKRYVMRKDIPIKTRKRSEIEKELFARASKSYKKAHDGKTNNTWVGEQVRMFMDNPQKMKDTDKLMKWLYSQYQSIAYYTDAPTSGRTYRDNKIIDMTYAVLTNQMTADKILNPGGFDAPKKMGYMVAAYKNPANKGIKWADLQKMSIDELKDLSYTDKDLTFADTQVQFYKQNSAAASLIGVFAVNKVAHATLESNDIFLDVSEICGDKPFTIAGTTFGIRMQIDKKYDNEGTLIGKTLGSLVSASADAVKDPILNLMNINMTTAGMLNTMLRLGMTFEDTALFLSQDIIERTLNKFNRENLTNYESLSNIIEKWLTEYREKNNINDDSLINTEELTKEELVEGLTSEEHEATDYKVLLAFQKIRQLVDAMRKPTYATRFNSISSAVGPLIVDNLIIEHKMSQFIDANTENGTHFYTADGVPVDIDDIFFDHPVLKQFARTVDIAKAMFSDMPTGSTGFRRLLANLPVDISDKMYNDKKLLDQFSNFYQSYLLIQSGLINPKHLESYATKFPKWFMEQKFKEKYSDNALIQAIRMNVSKKTGRPYLMINITGMDEQRKEELRSAWIDLHKKDPELSQMLFNYSFFRAGIGFSPKTFMSLVPTYVKEKLKSKDGNASYVDTYRNFPEVIPDLVIDQFIRNNWTNNKLVPIKGGKDTHYNVDVKHNRLTVYRPEEIADLAGISYMKTKMNNNTYLWHLTSDKGEELVFELMKPLGNNGEYLEMSTLDIKDPLSDTTKTTEDNSASDLKTESPQESNVEDTSSNQVITKTEEVKNLATFADLIMKQVPTLSKEEALQKAESIKGREKVFGKFLQNVFKQKGLDLSIDEAINEFKKYC
nr:MAG TPA: ATP dependent DNA helicase [Caudoviricetes sp.]